MAPRFQAADPEPGDFGSALRAGGRYVRWSPVIRRFLGRVALAEALPTVAHLLAAE